MTAKKPTPEPEPEPDPRLEMCLKHGCYPVYRTGMWRCYRCNLTMDPPKR